MKHLIILIILALCLSACLPQGSPTPLLTAEITELSPPSGRIIFQSNRDDNIELYAYHFASQETERLSTNPARDEEAAVSSENGLLFQRFLAGNYDLILLVDNSETNLSASPDTWETQAVFSPDGSQIAYLADVDAADDEIFLANADGTSPQQLTDNNFVEGSPSFSPNGTELVFHSNRDGNNELYILNLETSETRRLSDHAADDFAPAWSPNGDFIAFVSNREGSNNIYLMSPDGRELIRLTLEESNDSHPAWSPDSNWLAFESERAGTSDIWIMRSDGTDAQNIGFARTDERHPTWGD